MFILNLVIVIFILLEACNVIILYFKPDFKYGNGVAVFKQWGELQKDENTRLFTKYMTNWVANSKLVFIFLLIVILFAGNEFAKLHAVLFMIFSVSAYYFSLHPLIKKMDEAGEITPKGYSKKLFAMISSFILMFAFGVVFYLLPV